MTKIFSCLLKSKSMGHQPNEVKRCQTIEVTKCNKSPVIAVCHALGSHSLAVGKEVDLSFPHLLSTGQEYVKSQWFVTSKAPILLRSKQRHLGQWEHPRGLLCKILELLTIWSQKESQKSEISFILLPNAHKVDNRQWSPTECRYVDFLRWSES